MGKYHPIKYGVIAHTVLYDKRLSLKAKGLWGYLQSKPDGWDFSAERIAKEQKDGRDGVKSALRELEKYGYLERKRFKDERGQWDYEYNLKNAEVPMAENPPADDAPAEKASIKKEGFSNKDISKKELIQSKGNFEISTPTPKEQSEVFFRDRTIQENIISQLQENGVPENIARSEIQKFIDYWTEPTPSGQKERWETEKTFEIRRRLMTWLRNMRAYSNLKEPKGITL